MADRFGQQFSQTLVPGVVLLDGYQSVFGSSGALTAGQTLPLWVKSITRNSAGNYTVVLSDTWASVHPQVEVYSNNAVLEMTAVVSKIDNSVSGAGGVNRFTFICQTSGVATDPPSDGGFDIQVFAHNSTAI